MARPPLELVWNSDVEQTPFDALLRAASRDPEVASGLALAYSEMAKDVREKLVEEIAEDANALALLLGVEREPALAQAIANALRACERSSPEGGLASARRDAAFEWGDSDEGGVGLVRHLHGEFLDALRVSWSPGAMDAEALPLSTGTNSEDLGRRIGVPTDSKAIPFERGVDVLTEALWRARREGREIPAAVQPFADVFAPPRRP